MRGLRNSLRARFALLPVLEALVLVQSMVVGFELRLVDDRFSVATIQGVVFALMMLLVMTAFGLYEKQSAPFRDTVQRVFSSYLVTLLIVALLFYLFPAAAVRRDVFAVASVFALLGLLFVRYSAHNAAKLRMPTTRVLVLGNEPASREVVELLRTPLHGRAARLHSQVLVGKSNAPVSAEAAAEIARLPMIVKKNRISEIVVALDDRRGGQEPLAQLLACRMMGVPVLDLLTFYEREQSLIKLEHLRTSWLIYGSGFNQSRLRAAVKRTFDVVVSTLLVLSAAPIMVLAAVAIRLDSRGPVLFRQERVRDEGVPFMMLKFRSMRLDAESEGKPKWASTGDDRITRVGRVIRRLRIDELPQLLNVVKGDMSFVGPRPERPYFVQQLTAQIPYYELRHNVRPGITGWAQVRLHYGASVEDAKYKLQYDLYYVKNHSLFLDLMILIETVQVVLLGKGAR